MSKPTVNEVVNAIDEAIDKLREARMAATGQHVYSQESDDSRVIHARFILSDAHAKLEPLTV